MCHCHVIDRLQAIKDSMEELMLQEGDAEQVDMFAGVLLEEVMNEDLESDNAQEVADDLENNNNYPSEPYEDSPARLIMNTCNQRLAELCFLNPVPDWTGFQVIYSSGLDGRFYDLSISYENNEYYLLSCYDQTTGKAYETTAPCPEVLMERFNEGLEGLGYFDQ